MVQQYFKICTSFVVCLYSVAIAVQVELKQTQKHKLPLASLANKTVCTYGCPNGQSRSGWGCKDCAQGMYRGDGCATTKYCYHCYAGKYSGVGATTCTNCNPGKYQNDDRSSACMDCPVGKAAYGTMSTSCKPCSSGTYTDEEGKRSCTKCLPGMYQDEEGTSSCISCPTGRYQKFEGMDRCFSSGGNLPQIEAFLANLNLVCQDYKDLAIVLTNKSKGELGKYCR
jgi:hypothetical protein